MTTNAKRTVDFPKLTGLANKLDPLIAVYNYGTPVTGNTGNTVLISLDSLLTNTANLSLIVTNFQLVANVPAPANSTAWVGPQGTMFYANGYMYYADATNHLVRWAANTF